MPFAISIVKCGGSLLNLPELPARLLNLLKSEPLTANSSSHRTVVVTGGGATADNIRTWDRRFGLHPADAHRLAIHAMSFNARRLAEQNQQLQMVTSLKDIQQLPPDRCGILDSTSALNQFAGRVTLPPESWDVTSDSLAAWFATMFHAEQLLLLKSCDLPADCLNSPNPAQALSDAGLTDPAFPLFVTPIKTLLWYNLRRPEAIGQPVFLWRG